MMKKGKSNFTVSIRYDKRLYDYDIRGSLAHVHMLSKVGIINESDANEIKKGLDLIRKEIESDKFPWNADFEDVHMNIEKRLTEIIGDIAGQMHTARSRNDQVALDMRLFVKDYTTEILGEVYSLINVLIYIAETKGKIAMPGYTHLQRGQPVLLSHHLLAYVEMLNRDAERFWQVLHSSDVMPLGSGAMAGSPYPLDRELVAKQLGFNRISRNSMDAVSDRDFLLDLLSASSIAMMHLSRLCEELILWSSDEFAFIKMSDEYTTGSSMMPQKRNPDYAELTRGRTGRVYGNLISLLTTMKGLPLTYNRDLQEDKEAVFDTVDTLIGCLDACAGMVSNMEINETAMQGAAAKGALLATDYADYLVSKGLPFRKAHQVISSISERALSENVDLKDFKLADLKKFSELFDEDIFSITAESSIEARDVFGGTAKNRVNDAIEYNKLRITQQLDQAEKLYGSELVSRINKIQSSTSR